MTPDDRGWKELTYKGSRIVYDPTVPQNIMCYFNQSGWHLMVVSTMPTVPPDYIVPEGL